MQDTKLKQFLPVLLLFSFSFLNAKALSTNENSTNIQVTLQISEPLVEQNVTLNTTKVKCHCNRTESLLRNLASSVQNRSFSTFDSDLELFVGQLANVSLMATDNKTKYWINITTQVLDLLNTAMNYHRINTLNSTLSSLSNNSSNETSDEVDPNKNVYSMLKLIKFEYYRNLKDEEDEERNNDGDSDDDEDEEDQPRYPDLDMFRKYWKKNAQ